ncbi:adenylate/guanylate cyclase domain-containing protein [Stigmatella sp. ncwal1]|uniref:Adenylate/guanylate cyclase domain-containing protein n=1 Tax=Stigmatella ashevillensis TaxID=2995309 RepID=A0ABT5DD07_9BACT|nr:adenylate/guanylate cyclase domain-containing protein [Stigmatella ashevillena]MDC0710222.1 adenylate/guanylate cyclase domain-containing protein [Stigmatella ashevillena]
MSASSDARLSVGLRLLLHGGSVLVGLFTFVYARLVCTFICGLPTPVLARTVAILTVLHISLRELLLQLVPLSGKGSSPARRAWLLSTLAWGVTGLAASILHKAQYPSFPLFSHVKFAVGYWLLGGALLGQLEYLLFERALPPAPSVSRTEQLRERLGRRLLEGYVIFTTVPAGVLLLTLLRFIWEFQGEAHYVVEAAVMSLGFTGIALGVAVAYGRSVRRDTERLLEAVRRVGSGDFQPGAATSRPDELFLVAEGINEMAGGLQLRERIREAFGRFVSPQVASEFIEKYARHGKAAVMGGERKDVVVLFSDLRDFTHLSESLAPEVLIEVLNGYFQEMVGAIQQHGGMVDKFIGDAVLAVFGLTEGAGNPARAAVAAGLEMQRRLEAYNARLAARGIQLRSGVGIHAGEAVAGYLGSTDRMEFTVIGHTVNVASRIEGQAREPRPALLFSEEVARRFGDAFRVKEVGSVALKGVAQEVRLLSVTGEAGSAQVA